MEHTKQPAQAHDQVRYRANPNFIAREIGGDSVLVPVGDTGVFDNSIISLNRTFSFLWQLFQQPCTPEEAVDAAAQQFSGPRDIIEQDIKSFVNQLLQYRLLEEEENND